MLLFSRKIPPKGIYIFEYPSTLSRLRTGAPEVYPIAASTVSPSETTTLNRTCTKLGPHCKIHIPPAPPTGQRRHQSPNPPQKKPLTRNWLCSLELSPAARPARNQHLTTASHPRPKALKSIHSSLYRLRLFPLAPRLHARSQNLIFRAAPGGAHDVTPRGAQDSDLIARVRKGDVEGFNLLVSRWEKRVFNYLLRVVLNREDALDVSQNVFLKV